MTSTEPYVFDLVDAALAGRPIDFHGHPVPADVQRYIEQHAARRIPDVARTVDPDEEAWKLARQLGVDRT